MNVEGIKDLRIRRTIGSIRKAFTEMLLEMPYEKITVTELSNRANINKKTFYRYYSTLDELLEELQLEYARPYVKLTSGLRYPEDADAIIREFLLYSSQQGPLYDAILSSGVYASILDNVLNEMSVERASEIGPPEGWNANEWSLYLAHVNSSQVRFYKQWVDDGRIVPVNRMVALGVRLLCNGVMPWQSRLARKHASMLAGSRARGPGGSQAAQCLYSHTQLASGTTPFRPHPARKHANANLKRSPTPHVATRVEPPFSCNS